LLVYAEINKKNHLINLALGCLWSNYADGYVMGMCLFCFLFGGANMFAAATGTTISCSLGRQCTVYLSLMSMMVATT